MKLIGEWIRSVFWGQNNQRFGKVISYSHSNDQLKAIADAMKTAAHFYFEPIRLNHEQFPFPSAQPGIIRESRRVEQIPLSENKGLVECPRPPFVTHGHPNFGWMIDLEIQYRPERYTYTNIRPHWELPKRIGIASKFFEPYREARIASTGFPSASVMSTERMIGIRIPSDFEIIWTYLEKHHANRRNRSRRADVSSARFRDFRTSDKGKYLRGVIQLFGNLFACGCFFEDPFWRDTLISMAGKRGSLPKILTKEQFRSRFGQLRGESLQAGRHKDYWEAYTVFDEFKHREFEDLVESGILFQGAELTCPQCGSRYWYSVDSLQQRMKCTGCFSFFHLKPEATWSYRLNDLVRNALSFHGTLAVIQALYTLEHEYPSNMFLFLPCQNIYEHEEAQPFTDLDLIYVKSAKFVIGEVKSDPNSFKEEDFLKIKAVAEELQPNEVVLAAPGDAWPAPVEEKVKGLRQGLMPSDVAVRVLPLRWI